MLDHDSFSLKLLIISGRYRNVLDDGNLKPGLTLSILMHFGFFEPVFVILVGLVIVELLGKAFQVDLTITCGVSWREYVGVELLQDRILVIEAVVLDFEFF